MRMLAQHRVDEGSFNESIQGLVKNSPWWLSSAAVHGLALLVLATIPFSLRTTETVHAIVTDTAKDLEKVEEPDVVEPDLPAPPEDINETPTDTEVEDETTQVDADSDFKEPLGEAGFDDDPFTGAFNNSAIGPGGNAGGGPKGRGSRKTVKGIGSSGQTDIAVDLGLKWLADHQDMDDDGRWDCDDFAKHDKPDDRCDGPGGALYDVGVTGLSLLAFLGAGYTDRHTDRNAKYAEHVKKALRFLMRSQDDDGCFGSRSSQHFMYNHAIAALAMSEAYWMTHNPLYKKPAQQGLNFIARSRNPYLAWRYEPRGGENDTSVTGWMVMALKSGMFAGLDIDADAFEGARLWIDKMTDPEFGQCGYNTPGGSPARPEGMQDRFPPEKSQSMTAVGMLTRIFLGEDPSTSEMIKKGADLCVQSLPTWNPDDGSIDMYYWYYGTLAMFQKGGNHWRSWNKAMKEAIVGHQHQKGSGARTGSWDPIGPWGNDGGRVYATACMVMCLEVYYRYDRVVSISYAKK